MRGFPSALIFVLFAALISAQTNRPASSTEAAYRAAANSAQRKFDYIRQNGSRPNPDPRPTVITENEMNAWLSSDKAQLPQGVKKLRASGSPGLIEATALVDFDEITAGRKSINPLLSLFSGTHEVQARAHARGNGGVGEVAIDSVAIDGVTVPRMALEYFIEKYIQPRHPEIGMNTRFKLAYRIDQATVGYKQLTIMQK